MSTQTGLFPPASISRYRVVLEHEADVPFDLELNYGSLPRRAIGFLRAEIGRYAQELVGVLCLDSQWNAIGYSIVSLGTPYRTLCAPRQIFTPALLMNAAGVVIFHHHPTGNPDPSEEDIKQAKLFVACGKLFGLPVVDFLIIGAPQRYFSFVEEGIIMRPEWIGS